MAYDFEKAFARVEDELLRSMIRNMKRHKDWETDEGFQWSMWQAEQLKALDKYKRLNKKKFSKEFRNINARIQEAIERAREEGGFDQEIEILDALKKGFQPSRKPRGLVRTQAAFFRLNDRKMDALIKATLSDMRKAETAILRMANDKYRKVIFDAQVYANSGAGTYEKAVDMATRDFLAAGLNCVEYANGARHTLKDYAMMAIRTASKRAYLQGEGEKRQEWGISTVIVNKRGNPCPKCLPFVGKVFIDDVWSGGAKSDGPYPLLSEAISAGLYHPNCKDSHTTYFPEISTLSEEGFTTKEIAKIQRDYAADQKQQNAQRQQEKYGRLAEYSLDQENQKRYAERRKEWKEINNGLSIEKINRAATDHLMQQYEERRKKLRLNIVPAAELKDSALNPVKADYTGLTVEAARHFNDTIEMLMEEYYSGLTGIKVEDKKKTFGVKFFATMRHYNSVGQKELILNPLKMAEYSKMTERIGELSKSGYCIKMDPDKYGEYIATHEFAHSLIDMESPLKNFIGADTKTPAAIRKEIKNAYRDYLDDIAAAEDRIRELKKDKAFFSFDASAEEQMEAFKRLSDAQQELNALKISQYSMENADEFMAEAFAQAKIGNNRSKYSDRVMEILDRNFKKPEPEIPSRRSLGKNYAAATKKYVDDTAQWTEGQYPGSSKAVDLQEYTAAGTKYVVDGKHVLLDYSDHEKRIADVIAATYGRNVQMVPRVVYPQNVQTPDYLIDGAAYDLKTPIGNGKNTLYGTVKSKKRQANNFIICIDKTELSLREIERQIEGIYASEHTRFVDTILLLKDDKIIKVYKRKK